MSKCNSSTVKIGLIISQPAHFPEMFRLASCLKHEKLFSIEMKFIGESIEETQLQKCEDNSIPFNCYYLIKNNKHKKKYINSVQDSHLIKKYSALTSINLFVYKLYLMIKKIFSYVIININFIYLILCIYSIKKKKSYSETIIVDESILIFPNISSTGVLQYLLKVCKEKSIKSVLIPYSWESREELYRVIHMHPKYQSNTILGKMIQKYYPKWVYKKCLNRPPVEILAHELTNLMPDSPWMPDADVNEIYLESEAMKASYVMDGVDPRKIKVLGSATMDILSKNTPKQKLPSYKKKIISFLPPNQTGNELPGFEFNDYEEMLFAWINSLNSLNNFDVLYSLHPRMIALRDKIQQQFPTINIYDADIIEVIPKVDLCVGTISGVMRYALASGVPLIYYDVFNYKLNEYKFEKSVLIANSFISFQETLKNIDEKPLILADITSAAKLRATYWGRTDGFSVERITMKLRQLISKKNCYV